ncbi:MAG: ATP-binding cassette domain-containing protein [Flavobacteriales bacterium]|nr:ATP-binding cassette domain-containing protein [Flavobacteriales bacterium]
MASSESRILLKNVQIFQGKHLILKDVNLDIHSGEFVYMIGKTGSGKSSLLKTLYADIPLKDGEGMVTDMSLVNLRKNDVPFLRRKLGIVFQDFQLLSDRSVHDNLFFVLKATGWDSKKKMDERIEEVLDMVGLKTKGHKFPHELSGGEQQRVVIARALLNRPQLILADEPTGNLDPETSEEIIRLLINISRTGTAMLVATHDYEILKKYPSRTIVVEDSTVKEKSL